MTGFGYLLLVSGLEIEDMACFCGADEDDIEAWCKGRRDIPEDKLEFIAKKCAIDKKLLKKDASSFDIYEESRLFTAGVMTGALLNKDILRI